MTDEVLRCPHCRDATRWYWRKHRWIKTNAVAYGRDVEAAFVVYALCSANASVDENDKNFLRWCRGEEVRHFGSILARVAAADSGDLAGALSFKAGLKIVSFRENLRFPWRKYSLPTIDRHAADAVTGDRRESKNWLARKDGYLELARIYVLQAAVLGLRPSEWQARVWVHQTVCKSLEVVS